MIGIPLKPVDYDSQETTINMLAADDHATIYTCERFMLAKMEKLEEANPEEVKRTWTDDYAVKYQVPKGWIRIRPPKKLSSEQIEKLRQNGKNSRFTRQ